MELQGVDHVAFAVADQGAAISWFEDVLGLREEHPEWARSPALLARGGSGVALFQADDGNATTFLHLAFRVDRAAFEAARMRLPQRGVAVRFADHGTAHSLYFDGPGGLRLELTTYELGSR